MIMRSILCRCVAKVMGYGSPTAFDLVLSLFEHMWRYFLPYLMVCVCVCVCVCMCVCVFARAHINERECACCRNSYVIFVQLACHLRSAGMYVENETERERERDCVSVCLC